MSKAFIRLLFASAFLLLIVGVLVLFLLPPYINDKIEKALVLDNPKAIGFRNFQNRTTLEIFNEFSIFHINNSWDASMNGQPIQAVEFGPYVYRRKTWKDLDTMAWHANGTVQFKYHNIYEFVPELSNGSEADVITTVNLGYVGLLNALDPKSFEHAIARSLIKGKHPLFLNLTVKEFLWGYHNNVLQTNISLQVQDDPLTWKEFSAVYTGGPNAYDDQPNRRNVGKFSRWAGYETLPYWGSPYANQLNGSDGTMFPSRLTGNEKLYVFVDSIYRSFELQMLRKSIYKDIELFEYGVAPHTLLSGAHNPDNKAFFMDHTGIIPFPKQLMKPIWISFPHYFHCNWSDPVFNTNYVPNDNNNTDRYNTVLYVEPLTGQLFRARKRLQVNTYLIPNVTALEPNVREAFAPLMYVTESFDLDDGLATEFKMKVLMPFRVSFWSGISQMAVGLLILLSSVYKVTIGGKATSPNIEDYINIQSNA